MVHDAEVVVHYETMDSYVLWKFRQIGIAYVIQTSEQLDGVRTNSQPRNGSSYNTQLVGTRIHSRGYSSGYSGGCLDVLYQNVASDINYTPRKRN